jgi:hypothetical protein
MSDWDARNAEQKAKTARDRYWGVEDAPRVYVVRTRERRLADDQAAMRRRMARLARLARATRKRK